MQARTQVEHPKILQPENSWILCFCRYIGRFKLNCAGTLISIEATLKNQLVTSAFHGIRHFETPPRFNLAFLPCITRDHQKWLTSFPSTCCISFQAGAVSFAGLPMRRCTCPGSQVHGQTWGPGCYPFTENKRKKMACHLSLVFFNTSSNLHDDHTIPHQQ